MKNAKVLGLIIAGGRGIRLYPLTQTRCKAAVPFAGRYRLIDFVLSNFINSHICAVYVLTQFLSQSLLNHINKDWEFGGLLDDHFIVPVPAQMQLGEKWYQGTADAIYQNINLIENFNPDLVAVFGADHVYRMDIQQMIDYHIAKRAKATVAVNPLPLSDASQMGVVEIDNDFRVMNFQEKPSNPKAMPGNPSMSLVSMGNYIFDPSFLVDELKKDAQLETDHDFGKVILPSLIGREDIYAYNFQENKVPGESADRPNYWRDVGTIDSYYEANMDLRSVYPQFNMYNKKWPIRTVSYGDPPAKFSLDEQKNPGIATSSIICYGSIISGGKVTDTILGPNVYVDAKTTVESSIILSWVEIGKRVKIRNAIIDKNVRIPDGTTIGYNLAEDKKRFHVTDSGIVVVPKNYVFS